MNCFLYEVAEERPCLDDIMLQQDMLYNHDNVGLIQSL